MDYVLFLKFMMKCGSLLCLLLHLTAAITDKAVNASLLDYQTDPLVAIFDLSKANESDKLYVGEDTNTKMDAIKDHFKDKVGVNINDEIRKIVEEVLLKKGYYNYTDAVKKNTDAILRMQDDQKQMSARFNSRIKIIYTTVEKKVKPRECADVDFLKDGVYVIYPRGENQPKRAYCVWQDNRKWTVIQRRFDFSVDFYRSWNEYKEGFGTASGEHWLGNEFIHSISTNGRHRVKFILGKDGTKKYAEYSNFRIKDEKNKYKLKVSGYSGTAGDSIDSVDSQGRANGQKFSTYDRDNDNNKRSNCAIMNEGGWWYNSCDYASLNDMDSYKISWYFHMGFHLDTSIVMITKV
ncbi:angiopoietin-1-like [Mytilus galloprovincialis]|uniref:angiopoietin-1-like n=1 Tax=Mytilus galloprovincialis TaxID=29158 RepID=UPI003F7BDAD5